MTIDRFRLLHLRRLRSHPLRAMASILGIAAGVGLVVAMASLVTSATATARDTVALQGGARYEITVPSSTLDQTLDDVASLDGVDHVRRYIEVPIMLDDELAWLVAIEDRSGDLATSQSQALAATTGVRSGSAIPDSGTRLVISQAGVPLEVEIDGAADPQLDDRYGGLVIAADLDTALTLRGAIGAETLLVFGSPDAGALEAAAGVGDVRLVEDRVVQARNTIDFVFMSLAILGAMGLVVGGFLLFNTMNMTVLDRRHEIASLRAIGSDRQAMLRGILTEAAVLGGVGSALGLVLGWAMAQSVTATIPDALSRSIGTPLRTSVPAGLLLIAWLIGVATAMVSALMPARRALDIDPLEALRPDTPDPTEHRVTGRLWLIAIGLALILVPRGPLALGGATVGLLFLALGAAPFMVAATAMVARRLGSSGELAATALRRSPRRVWGTTTVVLVAVAVAVTTAGMTVNLRSTVNANLQTVLRTDYWIGTTTGDTIALTGLPSEWTAELEAIPGVEAVPASSWIAAESGPHIVGIQGVRGESAYPFSRLADDDARAAMLAGDGAIVLKGTAVTFDLEVGDVIDIPGATPPLQLPVVAITNAVGPNSGGMINISSELLAAHYGIDTFARYEIQLGEGADAELVRQRLDEITSSGGPSIQIYTGEEFLGQLQESTDDTIALIVMIVLIIILCAAIAVLNTLLASTLERTGEFAALRAIGATKRLIVTSVAAEAIAMGLVGGLLGAIAGSAFHAIIARTFREATAFHVDYAFVPAIFVAALAGGAAIAVVGAAVPCRRATRLDILDALAR